MLIHTIMTGGGGIIYYSVEKFGRPFFRAEERSFSVSEDNPLLVSSDQFKIVCILDGESFHEVEGIEGNLIKKGDILIAPKSITQFYRPLHGQHNMKLYAFLLFFDPEILPLLEDNVSRITPPLSSLSSSGQGFTGFMRNHFTQVQFLEDALTPSMVEIIGKIRREAEKKELGYRHSIHALCQDLVVMIARTMRNILHSSPAVPAQPARHFYNDIVENAKEYIFRHLDQEITLEQIAWHQHKSSEHLSRVFKSVTGQTVFEYIRETRLEQARIYLRDTRRTLTEIATLTGFSSLSYFSRSFQQGSGMTPSQYRKEMLVEQMLISKERRKK